MQGGDYLQYQMSRVIDFNDLADYTQRPTVTFLTARLSAKHSTHAAYLRTYTQSTLFSATSVSLVLAFTPENITTASSR
jgi:hypothetical protein